MFIFFMYISSYTFKGSPNAYYIICYSKRLPTSQIQLQYNWINFLLSSHNVHVAPERDFLSKHRTTCTSILCPTRSFSLAFRWTDPLGKKQQEKAKQNKNQNQPTIKSHLKEDMLYAPERSQKEKRTKKPASNSPPQQTELESSQLFLKYRRAFQTGIGQLKIKASTCYCLLKLLRKKKISKISCSYHESLFRNIYIFTLNQYLNLNLEIKALKLAVNHAVNRINLLLL